MSLNKPIKPRPLPAAECRRKAQRCLKKGGFRFGKAPDVVKGLMIDRDLTLNDLLNVIRASDSKISHEWNAEFKEWRYIIETERIKIWITFEAPERIVFISFRRLKSREE